MLFRQLEDQLAEITGFAAVSLQPNAGSQGEFAGLLVIRAYHRARGDTKRTTCLIPQSAHGTNPASAVMAGMQVVVVKTDAQGNIDLADLRAKAAAVRRHARGVDGDLSVDARRIRGHDPRHLRDRPRRRADRCTWTAPTERAGGPVPPRRHRRRRLPPQPAQDVLHSARRRRPGHGADRRRAAPGAASCPTIRSCRSDIRSRAGPFRRRRGAARRSCRSRGPTSRSWGSEGLAEATKVAILNANYIARRLAGHLRPALLGRPRLDRPRVHHRHPARSRQSAGIEVEDIAKRIIDYGFHPPTVSFPVAGHADDRADRERVEGGAGPLLRRADRDPRRDPRDRGRARADRENNLLTQRAAHAGRPAGRRLGPPLFARACRLPLSGDAGAQDLAGRGPRRRRLRRPQPRLRLSAGGGLRRPSELATDRRPGGPSGRPEHGDRRRAAPATPTAPGRPTLRLYRWSPPCLSFGRNEPARTRYDRAAIERRGLDVVRRPTGGRAVWHDARADLCRRRPHRRCSVLVAESYRAIHARLADRAARPRHSRRAGARRVAPPPSAPAPASHRRSAVKSLVDGKEGRRLGAGPARDGLSAARLDSARRLTGRDQRRQPSAVSRQLRHLTLGRTRESRGVRPGGGSDPERLGRAPRAIRRSAHPPIRLQ